MKYVVTGVAGFIGSTMAEKLLSLGNEVVGIDNFSTGQERFLENCTKNPKFTLVTADLLDLQSLCEAFKGAKTILHFAANADVRFGADHPRKDLEQNTIATHNVLEAMRVNGIDHIGFSSTGSVYGEAEVIPTPEDAPFPIQTSLYGASKLAGEALLTAYSETFGIRSQIFRFVSILGPRYTHGHVFDFCRQLLKDPENLSVLGNGTQLKSYLHVEDCINAVLCALESPGPVSIYNLGVDGFCRVKDSVNWICDELGVQPKIHFGTEDRGWIGDNPKIYLDTKKIRTLGWSPKYTIEEGVRTTVQWLCNNQWVFEARH